MESNQTNWEQVLSAKAQGQRFSTEQFVSLSSEERELIDKLEQDGLLSRSVSFVNGLDEEQAWKDLDLTSKTVKLYPKWFKYAAAAVLIPMFVATPIYFWNKNNEQVITTAEFATLNTPNHKRATLVLANGEEIGLNQADAKLKNVAGAKVENLDSTSLKYTAGENLSTQPQFNELRVPRGGEYKLILADGTEVWVNAESKLRFPVNFNGADKREVFLEQGEAYFEVTKNKAVPFIVHSGKIAIKVLGTSFNINTYSRRIKTTLVEGHVQVNVTNNNNSLDLLPNQQASFDQQTNGLNKENIEVESYIAWKNGWMIFESSELKEVMEQLGRWYDYDVVFESEALKQIHFGGKLRKYNEIGTLLAIIEKTGSVKIEVKKQTIYIKGVSKNQ